MRILAYVAQGTFAVLWLVFFGLELAGVAEFTVETKVDLVWILLIAVFALVESKR